MSFLLLKVFLSWLVFTLAGIWIWRERSMVKVEAGSGIFRTTYFGPRKLAWLHPVITGVHLCLFAYALCEWNP